MVRWLKRKPSFLLGLGMAMGLTVGIFAGALVGTRIQPSQPQFVLPEIPLHAASGGHGSDGFALCTGNVNEDGDALYTLDFLTGDLKAWVVNPNNGKFVGLFTTNVNEALGVEKGKKPNFAMVTGSVTWRGGFAGGARPGSTLVYVADANTGNFASYGLYITRGAAVQKDALRLVDFAKGRTVPERDR